jgi:hypothetical protein
MRLFVMVMHKGKGGMKLHLNELPGETEEG